MRGTDIAVPHSVPRKFRVLYAANRCPGWRFRDPAFFRGEVQRKNTTGVIHDAGIEMEVSD